jgi:hypothetical protein
MVNAEHLLCIGVMYACVCSSECIDLEQKMYCMMILYILPSCTTVEYVMALILGALFRKIIRTVGELERRDKRDRRADVRLPPSSAAGAA